MGVVFGEETVSAQRSEKDIAEEKRQCITLYLTPYSATLSEKQ